MCRDTALRDPNLETDSVYPGDIIQFERVKLKYVKNGIIFHEDMKHHTAIIYEVLSKGSYTLAHQNTGFSGKKVGLSPIDLETLKKGRIKIISTHKMNFILLVIRSPYLAKQNGCGWLFSQTWLILLEGKDKHGSRDSTDSAAIIFMSAVCRASDRRPWAAIHQPDGLPRYGRLAAIGCFDRAYPT